MVVVARVQLRDNEWYLGHGWWQWRDREVDRFGRPFWNLIIQKKDIDLKRGEKGKGIKDDIQVSDLYLWVDVSTIPHIWENRRW